MTNLEMVNGHKVGKEGQDVLDLQQVTAGQAVHGFLHILLLLHHVSGDLQPELLPELLVILG